MGIKTRKRSQRVRVGQIVKPIRSVGNDLASNGVKGSRHTFADSCLFVPIHCKFLCLICMVVLL